MLAGGRWLEISDAQEIREQEELWPLPPPKIWDCCFDCQRPQELSPIAIAQAYKPQAVRLHSLIPWLPPALQGSHITTPSPARCCLSPCPVWDTVVMGHCRAPCPHRHHALTAPPALCSCLGPVWKGKRLPWWDRNGSQTLQRLKGLEGHASLFFPFSFFCFYLLLPLCGLCITTQ